ncbi:hypothetical protein FB382_001197 [Nocardioides ginsengisegetis]|uniref:Uncharacterized protein n=1 Tax=Nocardioides ginsengisegetis TaxID=661491 RepID=A0A7W3IYE4_9ACTN|nr:hypothetical protein [Nocardioides ginsengisegetis]
MTARRVGCRHDQDAEIAPAGFTCLTEVPR